MGKLTVVERVKCRVSVYSSSKVYSSKTKTYIHPRATNTVLSAGLGCSIQIFEVFKYVDPPPLKKKEHAVLLNFRIVSF